MAGFPFVRYDIVLVGWTDGWGIGICGKDKFFGGEVAVGGVKECDRGVGGSDGYDGGVCE